MTNKKKTAIVYCEDQFADVDGKTAVGLVRHSEIYSILGVIDSSLAGKDAGEVLDGEKNDIPIFKDLKDALESLGKAPSYYIYGKAPLDATIPDSERLLILEAMQEGMDIVNGLHQFFSDDSEFSQMAEKCDVQIKDIRKPPTLEDLHVFTGMISSVDVPVIAVLGTDCACGKMTTAVELNNTLNDMGIKSVMIATGQTSLMQGSKYGASIDALVSQFVIGEIENAVVEAFENENPDIIFVEGQSAVSHPAFMSSLGILKGSMPDGVILQHAPGRKFRVDFPDMEMPTVKSEIQMIEAISQSEVIAITLSHEGISDAKVSHFIKDYEKRLELPTTDVLKHGVKKLVKMLADRFPSIKQKIRDLSLDPISTKPRMRNEIPG